MKTKIIALAGLLAMSLLTSVTLAAERPIGDYAASSPGGVFPIDGTLKDQGDCPAGTAFFKNQFPGLTNGPDPGSAMLTYDIDGTDVTFSVSWDGDNSPEAENSFAFLVTNGVAYKVVVTSDTNTLLYDHANNGGPVSSDGNLNRISEAADVNHLDFCLGLEDPGDIEPPSVTIVQPDGTGPVKGIFEVLAEVGDESGVLVTVSANDGTFTNPVEMTCVELSLNLYQCSYMWDTTGLDYGSYTLTVAATDTPGNTTTKTVTVFADNDGPLVTINEPADLDPPKQVSGDVFVVATVSDDTGLASVMASVYPVGDALSAVTLPLESEVGDVYTWKWDTVSPSSGLYTISVSATDTLGNNSNDSVTVEVVKSFANCFGVIGDEDFDPLDPSEPDTGLAGGCKPTPLVRLQTSQFTQNCAGPNPDYTCYLTGTLLKPADTSTHCGADGFKDPRMIMIEAPSLEYPYGRWIPDKKEEWHVLLDLDPALEPDVLAAVQAAYPADHVAPTSLDDALVLDENTYCANACCAFSQHVKGYETDVVGEPPAGTELSVLYPEWPLNALAFIKVHFPLLVLGDINLVAKCYDEGTNPDLQNTSGAGYQPLFQTADDSGTMTVLTQTCRNPARTLTRNNGFDGSNLIVSTAMPYVDAVDAPVDVLNFMYEQNEDDFLRLFAALDIVERDGLLDTGNFRRDVRSPVNQAKRRFDNFNANSLQQSIDALMDAEDGIRTKTTYFVTEANAPGEALSLIAHLIWDLGLLKQELERLEGLGIL